MSCCYGRYDIGGLFPDSDPAYKSADSMLLLRKVTELCAKRGCKVSNIDTTIIAQAPRLSPYIPAMREKLASALGVEIDKISVKATTEEGMGFTGEGLGIAAHAAVLLCSD